MAETRKIENLKWVAPARDAPFKPQRPSSGAKLQGWQYERRFEKYLKKCRFKGELYCGAWFEFEDQNGHGFAQPDFFILGEKRILIFECKLTHNGRGWIQLHRLYGPLLREFFERPVAKVQVCKNLRAEMRYPIISQASELRDEVVWHWRG